MATKHEWVQIGDRDAEGYRTFTTPGDVCAGCSDPERGVWVPVSSCPAALDDYYSNSVHDREFDEYVDARWRESMRARR